MIKKILIVDDSPVARKILKSCIPKDYDYEFHEASDGFSALEVFKSIQPDVTFMDITMPEMNGMECLEKIMAINDKAIVIMCTADVQIQSIGKAMSLGALDFIKKPASKETVQKALSEARNVLMNA
jgi:two-component system chemotaxis response regulator CheY